MSKKNFTKVLNFRKDEHKDEHKDERLETEHFLIGIFAKPTSKYF